jgi:hypothetical protein
MAQPQSHKDNGDIFTPFDWYLPPGSYLHLCRNELNILLLLLAQSRSPMQSIRIIHSTSRWLQGRSSEIFWDNIADSREWDIDDSRRIAVKEFIPGVHPPSRYTLPMEIRVRLGVNWLRANNHPEAMVNLPYSSLQKLTFQTDSIRVPGERECGYLPRFILGCSRGTTNCQPPD